MNSLFIGLVLQLVTGIYTLESSQGRNDSCLAKGGFNGYGYNSNKTCFKTHEEAQGIVASWVQRELIKGLTVPQLLCLYNTGKIKDDCEYYEKFKKI